MRYFAYLEFDGTAYCGWQVQPDDVSVQQCIEDALFTFLRRKVAVTGAGRTDAGVHASQMVAHFDLEEERDCGWLKLKLNGILPADIAIQRIVRVRPDAHARFDAVRRTYRYYVSLEKSAFERSYSWYLPNRPDFELMNEAAAVLLQTVDFTSFSKLHTQTKTNNCRVDRAFWSELDDGRWVFEISADRFLRNMVRAVVGTLMKVGRHQMSITEFKDTVSSHDRCRAGDSAPAHGLFLSSVDYPDDIFLK